MGTKHGLWMEDAEGEKWLHNPQLIVAGNPRKTKKRKGVKTMVRRRRRGRKASPRRAHRRNYYSAGMVFPNRPKRRRRRASVRSNRKRSYRKNYYFSNRRRRSYRSNPGMAGINVLGFQLPPMDAVLGTAAGFVVPPIMTSWVMPMLPVSWQTGGMRWVVKIASVLVPSMLVRQTLSRRVGNFMLIGGVASLAMDVVKEFAPGVIPGLGYQPMLGSYYTKPVAEISYAKPKGQLSQILQGVPERLSPQGRF